MPSQEGTAAAVTSPGCPTQGTCPAPGTMQNSPSGMARAASPATFGPPNASREPQISRTGCRIRPRCSLERRTSGRAPRSRTTAWSRALEARHQRRPHRCRVGESGYHDDRRACSGPEHVHMPSDGRNFDELRFGVDPIAFQQPPLRRFEFIDRDHLPVRPEWCGSVPRRFARPEQLAHAPR